MKDCYISKRYVVLSSAIRTPAYGAPLELLARAEEELSLFKREANLRANQRSFIQKALPLRFATRNVGLHVAPSGY